MKKICYGLTIICLALCLVGCGKKVEHVPGELSDLMKELYEGIPKDEFPKVNETFLNKENEEYFLGVKDLKFQEAIASEPMMSSIAHSVVLLRMDSVADVEATKKAIKENVNPRKWICVEVSEDNVLVESRGDLIVLIMDNEYSSLIRDNFYKLATD